MARSAPLLALALATVALGYFVQGPSENANAHYALVRALHDGTARVDQTRHEVGDLGTVDVSYFEGHYYSQKAPGLAFLVLPVYALAVAVNGEPTGDPSRMLWLLGVWGLVIPAAVALLVVLRFGDQLEPGFGAAAAVTVGLGTLLLPFAGLFHAHVLSAVLGFLAFATLWYEREGPQRLALVALGGLVAGLAVVSEYQLGLVALVLGAYAVARAGRARRAVTYAAGFAAGILPVLFYNWWAFGSPTHLSYTGVVTQAEVADQGDVVGDIWDYLFNVPSLRQVVEVLFARWGLVTATPVLVAAAAGLVLLFRRRRAEALVISGVCVGFLLLFAGLYASAFGSTATPRYAVGMLLFLGVPLALAFRAFPIATAALGLVSVGAMAMLTATHPLAAWDARVLDRLFSSTGHGQTILDLVGITGWYRVLPFFAVIGLGIALAAGCAWARLRLEVRDLVCALAAVAGWAVIAIEAPAILLSDRLDASTGAVAVLGLAAVVIAAVLATRLAAARWSPRQLVRT